MNEVYRKKLLGILDDKGSSSWIKENVMRLHNRDVVDVLNELEVLKNLFELRLIIDAAISSGEAA